MTVLAKVELQVWVIRGPGVLTGQGCFLKDPFLTLVLWLAGALGKVGLFSSYCGLLWVTPGESFLFLLWGYQGPHALISVEKIAFPES